MPFSISCLDCGYNEGAHYEGVFVEDACSAYTPDLKEAKKSFADFVESFNPDSSDDLDNYEIYQEYFGFTSEIIEQKIANTST